MKAINDLHRHNTPLRDELLNTIQGVVDSGWFVLGKSVTSFEQAFANYCGSDGCVSVGNGTDALELALKAVGVKPGDEVITVANAGGYSTTAILATGGIPRYIDINSDTKLMDILLLPSLINTKTKAIIVTHLYGLAVAMDKVMAIANAAGIPVIEDCAQAHGAIYANKHVGSWGQAGCFSFYPTKNLGALGDGGAVVTSDPQVLAKLRQLRQYGWDTKYLSILEGGRNSRLDEIQAAVLNIKLTKLDSWNKRRREIATRYNQQITHPALKLPTILDNSYVAHLYIVHLANRDELKAHLHRHNIPCDIHYPIPDYRQPFCVKNFPGIFLENTEQAAAETLTLPCFPEMSDHEVDQIAAIINNWNS